MIHIVYGTRAEIIKFSPLIKELARRKLNFKVIDTGDHDTSEIRRELKLRTPDYYFGKSLREVWSKMFFPAAAALTLAWGFSTFLRLLKIFSKEGEVIVYHGNTKIIPLVALAKKILFFKKLTLVHYESGMRGKTNESSSFDFYAKFGDKFSDVLFVQSESCRRNILKEKIKGKIVFIGDTVPDVIKEVTKIKPGASLRKGKYVLVNSTRSITSGGKASEFVNIINNSPIDVVLSLNPRMVYNLKKFGAYEKIDFGKVELFKSSSYVDFIREMKNSKFVITDSQGVQQESVALGKPCIVLNDFIQMPELKKTGLINVAGFDSGKILKILNGKNNFKNVKSKTNSSSKSTKTAADYLEELV